MSNTADTAAIKILLVGCGKMGSALLQGWLKSGFLPKNIQLLDPQAVEVLLAGVIHNQHVADVDFEPDFVVLAIKPQLADAVLPTLSRFKRAIFVSIMAGKTLHFLSEKLVSLEVARAMPNLPATIGCGFTAIFAPKQIQSAKLVQIEALFTACGQITWVQDEAQIDNLTAISGSGPAYVFLFAEALVEAAKKLGISEEVAKLATLQTIIGAAEMAKLSQQSLAELKEAVTSKGGTTAAAREVLEEKQALKELVGEAVFAAHKKAQQLA